MYNMWCMMQVGTSNCVPHMAHDAVKVLINKTKLNKRKLNTIIINFIQENKINFIQEN